MTAPLSERELIGIYLFLKSHEEELDETLRNVVMKAEKSLFAELSIGQFERLGELYRSGQAHFGDSAGD